MAWGREELKDPHGAVDKPSKVRRMFAAIAPAYDLNNRLHSLGMDQLWRRYAVRLAAVQNGERVLDVACGTGDLTQAFARTGASEVVGVDFTREMLDIAERKKRGLRDGVRGKISYQVGDAQDLAGVVDASFDVVSIAFGIRNVGEPERALREFARVLRPGGRLIVLEFDRPRNAVMRWLNRVYFAGIMPRTATLISGDRSGAYAYLPASVGKFVSREEMTSLIECAGFRDVEARSISLGNCACYRAWRSR